MNSDGSLAGGLFDLSTQTGIMHLLASVRASDLPSEKKHDLRDTIFLYTNGGRDQSVKISLEQKITSYQLAALPQTGKSQSQSPVQAVPVFTIGNVRPVPDQYQSRPVTVSPSASMPPQAAVQSVPVPPPVQPAPVVPTPPPVVPVQAAPVVPPQSVPVAPSAPVEVPIASGDSTKYLERIREIKALVNQRIGNPVNLVDINADVGREYMGALLDAMKKINSGTSAISAMKRLEDAYVSVNSVLDKNDAVPTTHEPAPVAPVVPAPQVPVPPPVQPAPVVPTPPVVPVQAAPVVPPTPRTVLPVEPVAPPLRPVTGTLPISEVRETATRPTTPPVEASSWSMPGQKTESGFAGTKLSSLANSTPSIARKPAAVPESTDPLYSADIDKGLDQLLSEWSLFKKSGLFGSGPKGREHPLFKKIAGLQIPLLLAGRFEGATQEIKQSITDYMNGWRYEQGIIYMQGETFERYLRRVIKHILDLQKKASRS